MLRSRTRKATCLPVGREPYVEELAGGPQRRNESGGVPSVLVPTSRTAPGCLLLPAAVSTFSLVYDFRLFPCLARPAVVALVCIRSPTVPSLA
jgi:hypothetical protein